MGIQILKGNIFDTQCDVLCHGCNTKGAYGGGIAGQVRKRYPEAYYHYYQKYIIEGWRLGDVQLVRCKDGKIIANCATQDDFGKSMVHADYPAIESCLMKLFEMCEGKFSIATVKIGCGLAGGNWLIVEKIFEKCLAKYPKTILEVWEPAA